MGNVNLKEAGTLAAGKSKFATEKAQKAKVRLAVHDKEIAQYREDKLALERKIEALHANGGSPRELESLREKRNEASVREQGLAEERSFLEGLLKRALEEEAKTKAAAYAAERARLQEEGIEIARRIRAKVREVEADIQELARAREAERIAKAFAHGHPNSSRLPDFDWATQTNDFDRDLLAQLLDRVKRAEREEENRKVGRPGGNVPGDYSMSQQRRVG